MKSKIVLLTALFLFPSAVQAAEKVTLQLRWDHQFQFAGYYAAKWRGYYADAGFDVEIRSALTPDGTILKAVDEVIGGRADFGVGAADILIARDRGADLVVLASIFQQSAAAFFALEGTPLDSPKDLLDLRVARNIDDLIDIELQAMLRAEGIDPTEIEPYPHEPGIAHVVEGRVDVMPGYRITTPFLFRNQGIGYKMLLPASYGVDFYGDALFTHRRVIERNPEAVERFVRATLKGWVYALEHPDQIADRIAAQLPQTRRVSEETFRKLNRFQIDAVKQLTHYPIVEVGHINPHRWRRMNEFLRGIGIVKTDLDADTFIFDPIRWKNEQAKRRNAVIRSVLLILVPCALFGIILTWTIALKKAVTRKTAALMESERQFRAMFENHRSVMLLIDPDTGAIVRANKAAENYYGFLTENFSGMTIHRINQLPKEKIAEAMAKAKAEKYNCFHFSHRLESGEIRDVEVHSSPIPFRGQTTLFSIVHDITERKRAEEALADAHENLSATLKALPDILFEVGSDGRIYDYYAPKEGMLYVEPELFLNKTFKEVLPADAAAVIQRAISEASIKGKHYGATYMLDMPSGRNWYELSIASKTKRGRHLGRLIMLVRNITDRKVAENGLRESEERYRTVIENSLMGIALRQGDKLLFANQAFCDMIGRSEEELLKTTAVEFTRFLHPDDRQTIFQRHLDRIAGKNTLSRYEYRYIHKDGSIVWVDALAQSIWINGQEAQLGMYVDITDRKRAEAALEKSLAEKEVLLREIHHRVKNNMQTIIGLLRMHARRTDDAQLTEIFSDCRDRIDAMSLIHEALYQSENLSKIDFNAYLKKLCRNLAKAHDAPRRRIDLTTNAADVSLDMDQGVAVGMIIAELISNAFKHAFPHDEGGGVSIRLDHPDGETVRLVVSDTGIGLPEDFDIQHPPSLGMRLVSGAVTRELGGTINVESDNGARFIIRFK